MNMNFELSWLPTLKLLIILCGYNSLEYNIEVLVGCVYSCISLSPTAGLKKDTEFDNPGCLYLGTMELGLANFSDNYQVFSYPCVYRSTFDLHV